MPTPNIYTVSQKSEYSPHILAVNLVYLSKGQYYRNETWIYSQVHKYWDIDTILTFLALYTTTMDFKWNEQDVL